MLRKVRKEQDAHRKYSPRREFVAFYDERDGKGHIKGSHDSAMVKMVK